MKKILSIVFWLGLLGTVYLFREEIIEYTDDYLFPPPVVVIEEKNDSAKDYNFEFVNITDDFFVNDRQEIINVLYTILDSGWNNFTFYCDEDYEECSAELNKVINDESILNHINNFVHPYNSFEYFETVVSSSNYTGVKISISKLYSDAEIALLDRKVDEVISTIITDDMDDVLKLRTVHDYIINNSVYDQKFNTSIDSNKYKSNTAYGPILQGRGICGGYSDAFAVFLDKLEIKNYKVASENHVWNYVFVEGKWHHIDLTWDDPVMSDGSNAIYHNLFMIDTATLLEIDVSEHIFDINVYLEAK